MTKKNRKRWWRHFLNRNFLAFLIVVHQNKWHFLESWDITGLDRYVLKTNFPVSKFQLFDLNLTWPWVRYENECHHRILRPKWPINVWTCVTRYLCYISMRWPHLTWPGPWPVLSISLLLTLHLLHPFSSILPGFGPAAVSGLVSAADKGDTSQLRPLTWPWPEIWPF